MNAFAKPLPRIVSLTHAEKQDMRITRLERLVAAMGHELRAMRVVMEQTITGDIAVPSYAHGVRGIIEDVAIKHGLSVADIIGRYDRQFFAPQRHEAMFLAHEAGHSLPLIGRVMGGRDHTTILHGVRAHRARVAAQSSQKEI